MLGFPTSTNWYIDVIKALIDLAAVHLDAGSQPPRRRRKYNVVDQRLKLKEAYVGGEKSIDRYIVGVAYNLSSYDNFCLCSRDTY